jgi:hypothetical protein
MSEYTESQIVNNLVNGRRWCDIGDPTPPNGEPMEMNKGNFYKIIAMRDELIDEQRVEISKLKAKVNQLQLKVKSKQ